MNKECKDWMLRYKESGSKEHLANIEIAKNPKCKKCYWRQQAKCKHMDSAFYNQTVKANDKCEFFAIK